MAERHVNVEDEYSWALQTAALVRKKEWHAIDRKALLAELEGSIAGGRRRELRSYIRDILRSRLSLKLAPKVDKQYNKDLLRNALEGLESLLWSCPSLREVVTEEFVDDAYKSVKYIIGKSIRLPMRCPYSPDQLLKEAEAIDVVEL